jgi:hypothetical protein
MEIDFKAHVIEWKKTFHLSLGRQPTDSEWALIRSIDKACRFKCREQIGPDSFFWCYSEKCINGMWIASKEKIESAVQKSKACARKDMEKKNERMRRKYRENPGPTLKRTAKYQRRNRERGNKRQLEWKKRNPDKVKQYYKTDFQKTLTIPKKRIVRLLRMRMRGLVCWAFSGRKTEHESAKFLIWLAAKKGIIDIAQYEIDHLIPISLWDLSTEENQRAVNSPENLQWLTVEENQSKRNKLPTEEQIEAHRFLVSQWRAEIPTSSDP